MSVATTSAYSGKDLSGDVIAAVTVTFLAIPQCVAYAMIAGLPPAMGLYAAALPAIIGALVRSSRHVVTGPSNAVSLLVGAGIAGIAGVDPITAALVLALLVGAIQIGAGALRLGLLVDYISTPVVLGYITGAGVLIGLAQLPNLTATPAVGSDIGAKLVDWTQNLSGAHTLSIAIGIGTTVGIVALRLVSKRIKRRLPGAIILLSLATLLSYVLDFGARGVLRVGDLAAIESGFPPLGIPDVSDASALVTLAFAVTVLSLVEASSVARAIATRTGQAVNLSREFIGQGVANLVAGVSGGYPTSGSLARSELNVRSGARTRVAGALGGVLMVLALLVLGPIVNLTPIPALAGLLFVIASDLVDVKRIRIVFGSRHSDWLAFVATMLGTWVLALDQAIYLGVAISVLLFLRRARLLRVTRLVPTQGGPSKEVPLDQDVPGLCPAITVISVQGQMFFAAAGELRAAIEQVASPPEIRAVVLRMRRARNFDMTTISVLEEEERRLRDLGKRLYLVGVTPLDMARLKSSGFIDRVPEGTVYPGTDHWFESLRRCLVDIIDSTPDHECRESCPLHQFIARIKAAETSPPPSA